MRVSRNDRGKFGIMGFLGADCNFFSYIQLSDQRKRKWAFDIEPLKTVCVNAQQEKHCSEVINAAGSN